MTDAEYVGNIGFPDVFYVTRKPDNMDYEVLEIGAGDRRFAGRFLQYAIVTDGDESRAQIIGIGIDAICLAEILPFCDRTFQRVIANNPYGYGFRYEKDAESLLLSVRKVLRKDGVFVILASNRNPYCLRSRVVQFAGKFGFHVMNQPDVRPSDVYPGHVFFASDGFTPVVPDFMIRTYAVDVVVRFVNPLVVRATMRLHVKQE